MSVHTQVIEINGVKHVLTFGLEFLSELNKRKGKDIEGLNLATGIQQAFLDLKVQDPVIIKDFIEIGTRTNRVKPMKEEIELYIQELFDDEEKEEEKNKLFDSFTKAWRTLPGAKKLEKAAMEAESKLQANQEPSLEDQVKKSKK